MSQPQVYMCPSILNPPSHLPPHHSGPDCPRALALDASPRALNMHWCTHLLTNHTNQHTPFWECRIKPLGDGGRA